MPANMSAIAALLASSSYRKQTGVRDNTLGDAQLSTLCPLDNGRHIDAAKPARYFAGQLDDLPLEILTLVMLYLDILSLTTFRRVNRRAMDVVDSIPQYAAIIKHCPDIIRASLSIEADSFSLNRLYATLSMTNCTSCGRFGDHLFLLECLRVCYRCFTRNPQFLPVPETSAERFQPPPTGITPMQFPCPLAKTQRRRVANAPSIISLPGSYCTSLSHEAGSRVERRIQLYPPGQVVHSRSTPVVPRLDKTTKEPFRFMAIVPAPHLCNNGRKADWGYFCLGCKYEEGEKANHFRVKYTPEELLKHVAKYGPVKESPKLGGRHMHVKE
ncbi:hypothetical protein BKA56DRAFT_585681 [Ilyonectria sp. MPI-CAGE-AT-0026]|nr:hypothetical protein BKA56DRAFT_585681 [Ilyonectria sp. MPI-CAGE-AT-0026]